jgi:phosphatidylglycerophosphate synthase
VDRPSPIFDFLFSLAILASIASIAAVSIGGYRRRVDRAPGGRASVILGPWIRGWYAETLLPFEELCVHWGIPPAFLSYSQLVCSLVVGYCYAVGLLYTGGWLLLFTGTLDIIDGRVARRTGSGSPRGAFLDSVIDRYADGLAFIGLAIFFRSSWVLWVVLFALLGGQLVSYARARAEGLGVECRLGLLQREERYVILGFGTIFGVLVEHITGPWVGGQQYSIVILALLLVAVLSNFTALQRVMHVRRVLGESGRV